MTMSMTMSIEYYLNFILIVILIVIVILILRRYNIHGGTGSCVFFKLVVRIIIY